MAKIPLDKYYTPSDIALYCIEKTYEVIGKENITDIIEPAAGAGAFSLQIENCTSYDIAPEHYSIIQQDYLTLKLPYKKGRLVIGNPPFGRSNNLSCKFYKKATEECDYIAFIQPINQYNDNYRMYQFNLIFSEKLPEIEFSGRKLRCCFNIYRRPKNNLLNTKKDYTLKDVIIKKHIRGYVEYLKKCDYRICAWGNKIGVESEYINRYCFELCFIIKKKYKNRIINLLKKIDYKTLYKENRNNRLQIHKILKYLKEQIPELK